MRPIALAAVVAMLFAVALPAQAGIRTDTGSLQNPDAITILNEQATRAAAEAGRAG